MTRAVRFAAIGAAGAVLQLALFRLLTRVGLGPAAATAAAVELVILNNFYWHERITWKERRATTTLQFIQRLGRFHVANGLVSIAGNTAIVACLAQFIPPLVAEGAAIAVCAPLNFLLADRCVYTAELN